MSIIGHADSPATNWNPMCETTRWIGRPWRRIELLTRRFFYKDEEVDRGWDLTLHLGFRRIGLGFTVIVIRASVLDYSDEDHE